MFLLLNLNLINFSPKGLHLLLQTAKHGENSFSFRFIRRNRGRWTTFKLIGSRHGRTFRNKRWKRHRMLRTEARRGRHMLRHLWVKPRPVHHWERRRWWYLHSRGRCRGRWRKWMRLEEHWRWPVLRWHRLSKRRVWRRRRGRKGSLEGSLRVLIPRLPFQWNRTRSERSERHFTIIISGLWRCADHRSRLDSWRRRHSRIYQLSGSPFDTKQDSSTLSLTSFTLDIDGSLHCSETCVRVEGHPRVQPT